MMFRLASSAHAALVSDAAAAHPRECCGLLLGSGEAITAIRPAANVDPAPHRRFAIEPAVLVEAFRDERRGGPLVLGYYHSHPDGQAAPSPTDLAEAPDDGRIWAIVAGGMVTLWRHREDCFEALPYALVDG